MTVTYITQPQEIDASTLQQWLTENQVMLIDVREPGEYANEHIKGATLMPLSQWNPAAIQPTPNQKLVLCCQSGKRSAKAAQKLSQAGIQTVTQLIGGISAWKAAGYPTETSKNAPISLMRQVQIVAGSLVLIGTLFGVLISPRFLILSGFVGAGLVFAGVSNTCALGMLLAKLPYNQTKSG